MKKCYFILLIFILNYSINAQVGINTNTPSATLHVQKRASLSLPDGIIPPRISGDSLRLKESVYAAGQNGAIVYVTSAATTTGPKTVGVTSTGLFVYDANATNSSGTGLWNKLPNTTTPSGTGDGAYAAKFTTNFNLLGIGILGGTVSLNLGGGSGGTTSVQVPSSNMVNGVYTVPSSGIYQISYNYKEGSGASVSLLTNSGISISRTPSGSTTATTLDSKGFGGVSVAGLLTVSITQTSINHLYTLNAGDKIQFNTFRQSVLTLDVATAAEADVSIFRIK